MVGSGDENANALKLNRQARAGVGIDAITYAFNYTTKMEAKFLHCDQFNEPVLKPGTPE